MRIEHGIPIRIEEGNSGQGLLVRQLNRDGEKQDVWLTKPQAVHVASALLQWVTEGDDE